MADAKSERQEIKKFGGKATRNSGRTAWDKGDAKLGPFVVDVKEYKQTFGLSRSMWAKISTDATRNGNGEPALMLALGQNRDTVRLWVIGDSMFHEMLDAWQEKYGDSNE